MPKIVTEIEKSYIAGFVDGEGCINIHRNNNGKSYTARLMIGNTNFKVISYIQGLYGGSLNQIREDKLGNSKKFYMLYLTGKSAFGLINDILPYLRVKKEQAKTLLLLEKHMMENPVAIKGHKGIRKVTTEMISFRENLKRKINSLNKLGHLLYSNS